MQRFWFLENVARMPYFSYTTMLTLYESLGWWRCGMDNRRIHFAEEWNELQHLKIMESLGGDQAWIDRFLGRHAAIFYFLILNHLWLLSPALAYNFSELIEFHAVDTYGEFVDANEELLKSLPPPLEALEYYNGSDLYLFDEFQTGRAPRSRRPQIKTLCVVAVCVSCVRAASLPLSCPVSVWPACAVFVRPRACLLAVSGSHGECNTQTTQTTTQV
ncbi:MAG: alternative oxidase [Promethearchaeia archaeon]